jgi:hypothetical protein
MWERLPAARKSAQSRLEAAPTGENISRAAHRARRSFGRHSGRPYFCPQPSVICLLSSITLRGGRF